MALPEASSDKLPPNVQGSTKPKEPLPVIPKEEVLPPAPPISKTVSVPMSGPPLAPVESGGATLAKPIPPVSTEEEQQAGKVAVKASVARFEAEQKAGQEAVDRAAGKK
jgi:hypothetical protein